MSDNLHGQESIPLSYFEGLSARHLVPYYLMASYAYYVNNTQFIADSTFDWICKSLFARWDEADHPHREYINKSDLQTVTCLSNYERFPLVTRATAVRLCRMAEDRTLLSSLSLGSKAPAVRLRRTRSDPAATRVVRKRSTPSETPSPPPRTTFRRSR